MDGHYLGGPSKMKRIKSILFNIPILTYLNLPIQATSMPETYTLENWIKEMKDAPGGSFTRFRWVSMMGVYYRQRHIHQEIVAPETQAALLKRGYDIGKMDGIFGSKTTAAI